jgi:hypothetical protein
MNRNPVSAAIELVDLAPSNEFRSTLRAQLLAGFTEPPTTGTDASQSPNEIPPESDEEYITLAPSPSRFGPNRRLSKMFLGAAACLAVFATGAVIANRSGHPNSTTKLHDVNRQEALPLAQHALIPDNALGIQWTSGSSWDESQLPIQAAATIAALPDCAPLRSVGLLPPTTKSATAHQFVPGSNYLFQQVLVFATPEDASRAMDVIASDVFPTCWFNLFDRLTPLGPAGSPSTSEAWDVPHVYGPLEPFEIDPHGDRQIIIGQHSTVIRSGSPLERYFINAFVQVGRTVSWVNPLWVLPNDTSSSQSQFQAVGVNEAITAATNALKNAIGP